MVSLLLPAASLCRSETVSPPSAVTAPTRSSQPLTAFVEAFNAAARDGLYATHFRPLVHPDLLPHTGETWLFRDRPQAPVAADALPAHVLRQPTTGELAHLARTVHFPVAPVKVLEFSLTRTEDRSKTTSRIPLFLAGTEGAYTLVFGVPKTKEEIAALRAVESLRYDDDSGAWKQLWTLQMAARSEATYFVVLADADGNVVKEIAGPWALPEGRKTIRFMLHPEGSSAAVRTTAQGKLELPYAWQAGTSARSSHAKLPFAKLVACEPVKTPAFSGDTLVLAKFTGIDDTGAAHTLLLQLRRQGIQK